LALATVKLGRDAQPPGTATRHTQIVIGITYVVSRSGSKALHKATETITRTTSDYCALYTTA
jgi:hypothetical protein